MSDLADFINGDIVEHYYSTGSHRHFSKKNSGDFKMKIRLPITVVVSKKIKKEGKEFNILEGTMAGVGVFKTFVREQLIPDNLEGRECMALFSVSIDKDMNFRLRFEGIDSTEVDYGN